jgi:PST family polysaccharide transporter
VSTVGANVRAGVVWSTVAFAGGRAATFLSTLVLARLLVPSEFGVVAAALVYLALIELASDLGMKATVVYEQEEGVTDRVQTAFTLNLLLAAGLSLVGLLLAPAVAGFFHAESETLLFRLAALNPLLTGLGNIQDGLLLRGMAFRRRTIPQVLRSVVRGVVGIALALGGAGAAALIAGFLAGTAAWVMCLWVMAPFRPTLRIDRAVARSMLAYGSGASLLEVIAVIGTRVDAVIVGRLLGPGSLGLYSVAQRVPELAIENVSWNVSIVAFPALARKRATDPAGLGRATLTLLRFSALYALPASAGLAIVAHPATVVLFSQRWSAASGVMAAVAVLSAFLAVSFPLGDVFKALGRQRVLVVLNVAMMPLLIAAMTAAAPAGIVAAAWARTAVAAANCLVITALAARSLGLSVREVLGALRPAAAATVGVAAGASAVVLAWPVSTVPALLGAVAAGGLAGAAALGLAGEMPPHVIRSRLPGPRARMTRRWGGS